MIYNNKHMNMILSPTNIDEAHVGDSQWEEAVAQWKGVVGQEGSLVRSRISGNNAKH